MQICVLKSPQLIKKSQNITKMPSEQYKEEELRIQKALESLEKKNPPEAKKNRPFGTRIWRQLPWTYSDIPDVAVTIKAYY